VILDSEHLFFRDLPTFNLPFSLSFSSPIFRPSLFERKMNHDYSPISKERDGEETSPIRPYRLFGLPISFPIVLNVVLSFIVAILSVCLSRALSPAACVKKWSNYCNELSLKTILNKNLLWFTSTSNSIGKSRTTPCEIQWNFRPSFSIQRAPKRRS